MNCKQRIVNVTTIRDTIQVRFDSRRNTDKYNDNKDDDNVKNKVTIKISYCRNVQEHIHIKYTAYVTSKHCINKLQLLPDKRSINEDVFYHVCIIQKYKYRFTFLFFVHPLSKYTHKIRNMLLNMQISRITYI